MTVTAMSIALVTRDRPASLQRALESVRQQSVQPHEIVVADDSERHAREVRELARRYGCRHVQGPMRGLYANRNVAARACRGTHVRTMDDDHTLPAGHLAICVQAVASDPGTIWVIGERQPHRSGEFLYLPIELHPRGFGTPADISSPCAAISDGATIYPRSVYPETYELPEFAGYSKIYLLFGAFLASRGITIRVLPDTFVDHWCDERHPSLEPHERAIGYLAMLTLTFAYRRSPAGMLACAGQITSEIARSPRSSLAALREATTLMRRHPPDRLFSG